MLRVGNDIVDLTHPNARDKSRDVRFLKRVFLPEEEEALLADHCPDSLLWALWTGKEAAYKVIRKDHYGVSAAPRRYKVVFEGQTSGEEERGLFPEGRMLDGAVETPLGKIYIRTLVSSRYVHSLALPFPHRATAGMVFRGVEPLPWAACSSPSYESDFVRDKAIRQISRHLQWDIDDVEIRRNKEQRGLGPPYVCFRGRPASLDISLSHDGRYSAYAFTLPSGHLPKTNS